VVWINCILLKEIHVNIFLYFPDWKVWKLHPRYFKILYKKLASSAGISKPIRRLEPIERLAEEANKKYYNIAFVNSER
jgi:hypothetical protein